jgi:hypothetical protein
MGGVTSHAASQAASWLDRPLTSPNVGVLTVPSAPATLPPAELTRCRIAAGSPSEADAAVSRAGWTPFLHQDRALTRGDVTIVAALAAVTTSCEPATFQLFVFVDGKYAGALSPAPMMANRDGAAGAVRITGPDSITAEFARYATGDSECCPSSRVRVSYVVEWTPSPPRVRATGVQALR